MIKTRFKFFAVIAIFILKTTSVLAQQLIVTEGHVRASIPGTNVSSGYMTLKNTSDTAITLIGATSRFSDRIEIHEHVMKDGMMSMRQRDKLTIAAHSEVKLQPYGYHLMIFDLANPLIANNTVSITLQFSKGDIQIIELPVQSIKKPSKASHH